MSGCIRGNIYTKKTELLKKMSNTFLYENFMIELIII